MGRRVIVFADYTCPYCYLAQTQLARLTDADVQVDSAAFELRPAGTALPDADAAWMREAWSASVLPLADAFRETLQFPQRQVRTRKAHEAVAYAREEGRRAEMDAAIYRAYWQDGLDIGRIDVLVELGVGVGLDRTALKIALDIDQWSARVEQDQALARQLRLTGVPAYVLVETEDGAQVRADLRVGLLRHEQLKDWVTGNDVRANDGGTDT